MIISSSFFVVSFILLELVVVLAASASASVSVLSLSNDPESQSQSQSQSTVKKKEKKKTTTKHKDLQQQPHEPHEPQDQQPYYQLFGNHKNDGKSIIGGRKTNGQEFPFFVQSDIGCGGSLVAPDVVLSAGHCYSLFDKMVLVGSYQYRNDSSGFAQWRSIVPGSKVLHPDYWDNRYPINDLLLFKIEAVTLPNLTPIRLYNYKNHINSNSKDYNNNDSSRIYYPDDDDDEDNDEGDDDDGDISNNHTVGNQTKKYKMTHPTRQFGVIGYGITNYSSGVLPKYLQKATVNLVDWQVCATAYKKLRCSINDTSMLCAYAPGRDACLGDSGGPIFDRKRRVLLGVTSFGKGCAADYPGVYARTSGPVIDWIEATICELSDFAPTLKLCKKLVNAPSAMPSTTKSMHPSSFPSTSMQPSSFPTISAMPTLSPVPSQLPQQCLEKEQPCRRSSSSSNTTTIHDNTNCCEPLVCRRRRKSKKKQRFPSNNNNIMKKESLDKKGKHKFYYQHRSTLLANNNRQCLRCISSGKFCRVDTECCSQKCSFRKKICT